VEEQLLKDILMELKGVRLDLNAVISALAGNNVELETIRRFLDTRVIWNNEQVTIESPEGKSLYEGRISVTKRTSAS
jgi:hypothetical protein